MGETWVKKVSWSPEERWANMVVISDFDGAMMYLEIGNILRY